MESPKTKHHLLVEDEDDVPRNRTLWHPIDWLVGTISGQILSLLVGAAFIILAGAGIWRFFSGGNNDYDDSWEQSIWFSWGMFFDPGTQMGLDATERPIVKFMASGLSIVGFLYNLVFLGLIVELSRIQLDKLYERGNRAILNGHTLVLGWTEKTPFMVEQLVHADIRGKPILVVAEADEAMMLEKIELTLSGKRRARWLGSRQRKVMTRRGCPQERDDLVRASAVSADEIIILGKHGSSEDSDLEVVQTIMALASQDQEPSGNIIASVKMPETVPVVDAILERAEGLVARQAVHRILCLKALQPLIGDTFELLASFVKGQEIYCKPVKDLGFCRNARNNNNKNSASLTFGEIRKGNGKEMKNLICIGFKRGLRENTEDELPIVIAPDDNEQVKEDDSLLVLADTMSETRKGLLDVIRKSTSSVQKNVVSETKNARGPCKICIVNWSDNTVDLIDNFDKYMHQGSEVHILSTLPEEDRVARLSKHQLKKVTVKHHVGPEGEIESIRALPLLQAHCIIVNGQSSSSVDDSGNWNDARVLACSITIREYLNKETDRRVRDGQEPVTTRLFCECYSSRMKRLLEKENSPLKAVATFFHSNSLETGLVAMAGLSRSVYNTLLTLMDGDDAHIAAIPWSDLKVKDSKPAGQRSPLIAGGVTFQKIQENLNKGQILLGYHAASTGELIINPGNRDEEIQNNDELIILQRGRRS